MASKFISVVQKVAPLVPSEADRMANITDNHLVSSYCSYKRDLMGVSHTFLSATKFGEKVFGRKKTPRKHFLKYLAELQYHAATFFSVEKLVIMMITWVMAFLA